MNSLDNLHLTKDALIGILYGLEPSSPHLKNCPECQDRFAALQDAREATARFSASNELLRQQRLQVLDKANRPAWQPRALWVPVALAAIVAVGLVIKQQPQAQTAPVVLPEMTAESFEADWFEDTYSAQASEPRAISPLRHLFVSEGTVE